MMPQDQHAITCENQSISFTLSRSKRKSLEIAVHPDGAVFVKAPLGSSMAEVLCFVHERARWIIRQIRHFEQFEPRTPPRQFVSGESHPYLGCTYRLKVVHTLFEQVWPAAPYLYVHTPDPEPDNIRKLLDQWYRRQAGHCFDEMLKSCWETFQHNNGAGNPHNTLQMPPLKIRKMKSQWGSLSPKRGVTLNLELIKTPRECIEYIIFHELCHLIHDNHGTGFYRLLERHLPDWKDRRNRLEMSLI